MTTIFHQEHAPLEEADRIIAGFGYDGTASNRPGARFGPAAIRQATFGIEDYSPYLDRDITSHRIHDAGYIELPFGSSKNVLNMLFAEYKKLFSPEKRVIVLGGEHLITLPVMNVLHKTYGKDLFIIQFDAHADLREEYLGEEYSHATVMHHLSKLAGPENVCSVGIRSGTQEEWKIVRNNPRYFGPLAENGIAGAAEFLHQYLKNRKIYITFDLDCFDPAYLPGTGTPEPGGYSFTHIVPLLQAIQGFNIVGADIVELAPEYDHSGVSAALAATLLRELILL